MSTMSNAKTRSFGHAIPDPLAFDKNNALAAQAVGAAMALWGGHASAATIVVNSTADNVTGSNSLCTLREALANANADSDTTGGDCAAGTGTDTISLAGVSGTITLGGTQLAVTGPTTFQGPGAGTLTLSGNNASRIFYIGNGDAGRNVTISGLTLTQGNDPGQGGGAIYFAQSGSLTIDNSTITGNAAGNKGGALFANNNAGAISITHSTLSGNTALGRGGALFLENVNAAVTIGQSTISGNSSSNRGGAIALYKVNAPLTITESTISGNSADAGGRGGGIFLYKSTAPGSVTIERSTISGNTAGSVGGGAFFYKTNSTIKIENSTLSGNAAPSGGGIYMRGPFGGSHLLDIRSSTIASNTATILQGGNIHGGNGANTIQLTDSIVAGGLAPAGPDITNGGATVTANFSLVQDTTGATIGGANNLLGVDPQLAALADNGGPTQTHLIASTSPALNAGTATGLPTTDQRGFSRNLGAGPDMGAVELRTAPTAFSFTAQTQITPGATVVSAGTTISGLDTGSAIISIVGGAYSINSGPFVTTPGTVQAGDVVTVRLNASPTAGATVSATLTVGGVASVFNVTSRASTASIPTLSEWGMAMLSGLLLVLGLKSRHGGLRKQGQKR